MCRRVRPGHESQSLKDLVPQLDTCLPRKEPPIGHRLVKDDTEFLYSSKP